MFHQLEVAENEVVKLPELFTFPYCYVPHPLVEMAAQKVQHYVSERDDWRAELEQGKMFGVLVVEREDGVLGYVAAFSGNLAGTNFHSFFVPPVFDFQNPDSVFQREMHQIESLSRQIDVAELTDSEADRNAVQQIKAERAHRSARLQRWLFSRFKVSDSRGRSRSIRDIFIDSVHRDPPSGAGECAAPKMLHYAFTHSLRPIAMGEFWWGNSPKGLIRRHLHFYPACHAKCRPLLDYMLREVAVEPNRLSMAERVDVAVVSADDEIGVVDKPAGFSGVPGLEHEHSCQSILSQQLSCEVTAVHRLDMATSGLMIFARNRDALVNLRAQFEAREVKKRYVAVLDGVVQTERGKIELPLSANFFERPMQQVDFEHGKKAVTYFRVLRVEGSRTRVHFWPLTGRTHQLRVHAASPEGLDCPIVGDNLYGRPADRLLLHADSIVFKHPATGRKMEIDRRPRF